MTTQKKYPIVLNIDFHPVTEEGNEYRAKFGMFATTNDAVDLQGYSCDLSDEGDLIGTDEVYTSPSGKQIRVVTRPVKAKAVVPVSDARAKAIAKAQAIATANFTAQQASSASAPETDAPF